MRKPPRVTTIDFETDPIQPRPDYPPKPVGVSIRRAGEKKSRYYAWGHYTGDNNCTRDQAQAALAEAWADRKKGVRLLFQNAQFDVDVAVTHMGMELPAWYEMDDTMFLLFLWDPHAPDLQLKPAAERILGLAPDEKDELVDWLYTNKKRLLADTDIARWTDNKGKAYINSKAKLGALVAYAPGEVAGRYACGDTDRTLELFRHLWPRIQDRGMEGAYDRERELMPILLENEKVGMRVDVGGLRRDVVLYEKAMEGADIWLRKRLGVKDLNLDADDAVAEALAQARLVRDEDWTLTATGKRSVAKKNLRPDMIQDPKVASAFGYRNRMATCLKMFMQPWLYQAERRGVPFISTNWNQVRQPGGGTRTGRPSTSDPNFLNLSKTWYDKNDGYEHPGHIRSLPELPLVRRYIMADKGGVFLHRDFDGQELRVLGHFEDGALMRAYQENPTLDVHNYVGELITRVTGLELARTNIKITNFRRIYGGGAPALMLALNISKAEADEILKHHAAALPDVFDRQHGLTKRIKDMSKAGEPLTTWGGREYYVEPPKLINGRMVHFEYKLLNYLVQGSAADCTKEAIIRYHNHPKRNSRFLVTVYDEINASTQGKSKACVEHEMAVLRECMEGIELDVPLLSSGKTGPTWGDLTKFKEKPYG